MQEAGSAVSERAREGWGAEGGTPQFSAIPCLSIRFLSTFIRSPYSCYLLRQFI